MRASPIAGILSVFFVAAHAAGQERAEPLHERAARAVEESLPLLQESAATWIERRSCVSCHHQGLGLLAVRQAAEKGFRIDEELFGAQVEAVAGRWRDYDPSLEGGSGVINYPFGHAYLALALAGVDAAPRDGTMQAFAHGVAGQQHRTGSWRSESHRPPLEDTPVTLTALALRSLQLFLVPGREDEMERRVMRATAWLERLEPATTEEAVFRLWGLAWGAAAPELLERSCEDLLAMQREDGGWAQIPTRSSDAYATGQALVTLHEVGGLEVDAPAFRRGAERLLELRKDDGSWHVATRRRLPGLPHFDTGFPHGPDQFISYAASAWATMALAACVEPGRSRAWWPEPMPAPAIDAIEPALLGEGATALHRAALFGDGSELQHALSQGLDPNAATKGGLTALMAAAHDPRRVALLLEAGAEVDAATEGGVTALQLAAAYAGNGDAMEQLLAAGASIEQADQGPVTPLVAAIAVGDVEKAELLIEAGADPGAETLEGFTPLLLATTQGDVAAARALIELGADVEQPFVDFDATPLMAAALDGDAKMVRELIRHGADVNRQSEHGLTPLMLAALVDPGHVEVIATLLAAGANVGVARPDGATALDVARLEGHPGLPALEKAAAEAKGDEREGG